MVDPSAKEKRMVQFFICNAQYPALQVNFSVCCCHVFLSGDIGGAGHELLQGNKG